MNKKLCWSIFILAFFITSVAYAEGMKSKISSKSPTEIKIPAKTELLATSVSAVEWSNDPLAGLQNALMLPGVSVTIPVDGKTLKDIKKLVDSGTILVRKDLLTKVMEDIEKQIGKSNKTITLNISKDDYGWVVSEIWKKYLFKRNPKAGIDLSYFGACGEKGSVASRKKAKSVFLGEFPGIGLPVASLIATAGNSKPVKFCKVGDKISNKSDKDINVVLQINDDQPGDNSGFVELEYKLVSK